MNLLVLFTSPRPNTPAAEMEDNVSDSIKKKDCKSFSQNFTIFQMVTAGKWSELPKEFLLGGCFAVILG